ncbi:MAG: hypothetical protein OEY91_14065 [Nitrospirota bacterium]|nr:hypothetical protein [Nitrospirota bacterium]
MRKLILVLVFLLAPSFTWGLSGAFRANQGLYFDTAPGTLDHGMLVETEVENNSSSSSLDTRAENPERQNSADSDEPEEEEPEGSWTIGGVQFTTQSKPNPPLKVRSAGPSSLSSYNFVGKVGGVSFEQVATPAPDIAEKSLQLLYDSTSQDGSRLVITIGSDTFRPPIADWMLLPIAHFADSEFTAAISLFGDGPDTTHFYHIQYHPAFQNTLLGLRLLQADILLMDVARHKELPKRNGHVVLGFGEHGPTQNSHRDALIQTTGMLRQHSFTSWVLTDTDVPSSFFIQEGAFRIQNSPYYYFWRRDEDSVNDYQDMVAVYNRRVGQYNQKVTGQKTRINTFNDLVRRFNANNASVPQFTLDQLEAEIQIGDGELMALEQELNRLQGDLKDGVKVQPVPALTHALQNQSNLLEQLNPLVFHAIHTTAEYAAFFRYMKFHHPQTWEPFLQSIAKIRSKPVVKTPTQMPRTTS